MHTRDHGRHAAPETAESAPAQPRVAPDRPAPVPPKSEPLNGSGDGGGHGVPAARALPGASPGDATKRLGLLGRIDLPGEPASASKARRYLRVLLANIDHPRTDDAMLLVSELVCNAVRHSDSALPGGQVTVGVAQCDGTLHIDVIDAGSAVNVPRIRDDVDGMNCSGRGLWLVRELASSWGWHETDSGRVVWFQLADT